MRKIFIVALFVLCGINYLFAAPISKSEARLIAQAFIEIADTSTDDVPTAPYYIFSRGANQGFVIVSGDDSTAPIIGYTEQGDFNLQSLPEPLRIMLTDWSERIEKVQARKVVAPRRSIAQRLNAARYGIAAYKKDWTDVGALVQTHWHQSSPYNDLAPVKEGKGRCMTGCVATAGSQVTYYFHKDNPDCLAYDTPTYGYGTPITVSLPKGTPIEWDLMKLSGSGTAAQNKAVATLMYALGTSAWLTYGDGDGTATSGHNYKMADAMRGHFQLDSRHCEKANFTQQAWEELIYKNLSEGRPMLYSGVHPTSGGHSVVLDGYQASTGLFHFNFGWGGQGDGWYTVDDATGMNGFNSYQDLICDITPQRQNLKASMKFGTLYHSAPNTITITVKNDGTLNYKGIFLYTSLTSKFSATASASMKDYTVLKPGQSVELNAKISFPLKTVKYIFLCDNNKNILDSCRIELQPTVSDLSLTNLYVDAGTETTTVDNMDFSIVNNTTARVNVKLTNGVNGSYCKPAYYCYLDSYDSKEKTWKEKVKELYLSGPVFKKGQTKDTMFVFKSLTPGTLYRARMGHQATTSGKENIAFATADSLAYFTVREGNLTVETNGRHAVVKGKWDMSLFADASTAEVCTYDITNVEELSAMPKAKNPNALFYSSVERLEWAGIPNIIMNGECGHLVLHTSGEFKPNAQFTAKRASFIIDEAQSGHWGGTVLPFKAAAPYGMQLRAATSCTVVKPAFTETREEVDALTPVLYLTGNDDLNTITAQNVVLSTDTIVKSFNNKLIVSTVNIPMEAKWLLLGEYVSNDMPMPYFLPVETQPERTAFIPIFSSLSGVRVFAVSNTTIDAAYRDLSTTCNEAHQTLTAYPHAPQAAIETLQAALTKAEDILTYCTLSDATEIETEITTLQQAIDQFIEAAITGITFTRQDSNMKGSSATEYFNLSGQRLNRPAKGVVIVRQNGQSKKTFIR